MQTYNAPVRFGYLGVTSIILGCLGAAFYWWTPLGMVLSLAGWLVACVGWLGINKNNRENGVLVAGMVLCLAALVLNIVISSLGLELVRFHQLD